MSLGKLLATGRSLAGGPSMGRYNVSESNRLPKFNSAKNPFAQPATKAASEAADVVRSLPVNPVKSEAVVAPASVISPFAGAQMKETQRIPHLADPVWLLRMKRSRTALVKWIKRLPALSVAVGEKVLGLVQRVLGRVPRLRRKSSAAVFPGLGKPAVQGELSLDNVKVVRNDLEESDLEIVTAQTDTGSQVAPSVPSATPNRGPVPPALKKLTNRIVGVNVS